MKAWKDLTSDERYKLQSVLLQAADGDDFSVGTERWLVIDNADEEREVKISPHGNEGDFDTDCYWVEVKHIHEELAECK